MNLEQTLDTFINGFRHYNRWRIHFVYASSRNIHWQSTLAKYMNTLVSLEIFFVLLTLNLSLEIEQKVCWISLISLLLPWQIN